MFTPNRENNNNTETKTYTNKEQIILNICFNPETGKLVLSDNYDNHYLCDLFGRIKKKFLPNVTGQASFQQRKEFFANKNLKTEEYNMPKTSNNFFLNEKNLIEYYPQTRRFEGYFNYPRPLEKPFCNIPDYVMKDKTKKELIQHLEKYFTQEKNKKILDNKISNIDSELSYLTGDLNEFDCLKVDSEKLLKLIKQTLDSIKEEYALKMNMFNKIPMVKALNQFTKYIQENKESIIINNRKLKKPNLSIKKKYDIIHKTITNFGLRKDNFKNKHFLNINTTYNNNFNNYKKRKNLTLDSHNNKYKKTWKKNLFINDFTIGRKINMNFGFFSYEEELKKKQDQKNIDLTKENLTIKNTNINNNKETEATKETEQSLYVKTLDDKIKDNNLSFISKMNDKENNYQKNHKKKIKHIKYIMNRTFKENELLKGFKIEERKGPILLIKNIKPKLKTNGELFDEDMKLLRKTNPIAFHLQEKKDEFDLKQLAKKLNMLKINETNVMKGKKLKIEKEIPKDDE